MTYWNGLAVIVSDPPHPREIFKSMSGLASNWQLSFWVTSATFLWKLLETLNAAGVGGWCLLFLEGRVGGTDRCLLPSQSSVFERNCLRACFFKEGALVVAETKWSLFLNTHAECHCVKYLFTMLQEYVLLTQQRKLLLLQRLRYSAH